MQLNTLKKIFLVSLLLNWQIIKALNVNAGEDHIALPSQIGQNYTLGGNSTAGNGDAPYSYKWYKNGVFDPLLNGANPTITIEANSTNYRVEVVDNKGETCDDIVTIKIADAVLHPQPSDFIAGKCGRMLISTFHDDNYYTTNKTTMNNTVAQTNDAQIAITIHFDKNINPNPNGQTIYFKLEDIDDASPYETDQLGGDNKDPIPATLSANSAAIQLKTINGLQVYAAEVTLSFTKQYAGDNYVVKASLDPNFIDPNQIFTTTNLIAWKRMYLEEDRMYSLGATITIPFVPDNNASDDILTIDDVADFEVNDKIIVFKNEDYALNENINGEIATVISINNVDKTITVTDLNKGYPKYAGVRFNTLDPKIDTASIYLKYNFIENAFGSNTNGDDTANGTANTGAFVEFYRKYTGSTKTPKYKAFINTTESYNYCKYWFNNILGANDDNVIQGVLCFGFQPPFTYLASTFYSADNIHNFAVYTINYAAYSGVPNVFPPFTPEKLDKHDEQVAIAISDGYVHELGHFFKVASTHVDENLNYPDNSNKDQCLMSYSRIRYNNIIEFDKDFCIKQIKEHPDPIIP